MTNRLLDNLRDDLRAGNICAFVGTGVSLQATRMAPLASWAGLLLDGVDRCVSNDITLDGAWAQDSRAAIGSTDLAKLLRAAEDVSSRLGAPVGGQWSRWLRETVGGLQATDRGLPQAIARLGVPVLTTNYDGILDDAVGGRPATWRDARRVQRILRSEDRSVAHLHGYWDEPESVVLGIESYEAVIGSQPASALQQALVITKSLLFIGVGRGLEDPNWTATRDFLKRALPESECQHYFLCRTPELADLQEVFCDEQIMPVAYGDDYGALEPFLRELGDSAPERRASADEVAPIVRVAIGVILKGREVILVQRRYREGDLEWTFVGGFVNPYRDPRQQICEEIKNETGLTCRIVEFLGEREHPKSGAQCLYYSLRVLDGELTNGDTSENLHVGWVQNDRVYDYLDREDVFAPVRQLLEDVPDDKA